MAFNPVGGPIALGGVSTKTLLAAPVATNQLRIHDLNIVLNTNASGAVLTIRAGATGVPLFKRTGAAVNDMRGVYNLHFENGIDLGAATDLRAITSTTAVTGWITPSGVKILV